MNEFDQAKDFRKQFLRAAYELCPDRANRLVGLHEVAEKLGLDFSPEGDIGKLLYAAQYLGEKGFITEQKPNYSTFSVTSKGLDEVEGNNEQADRGPTFQFYGNVQGSVIGTHNTAERTNLFDFRSIEVEIEERGGEDTEELKAALAEVRNLVEAGESLDRGALSKFSGVMEKHSWFTGSVMQALLGFATQAVT
jgi:hypothetical protein